MTAATLPARFRSVSSQGLLGFQQSAWSPERLWVREKGYRGIGLKFKMAETSLIFSSEKTSFDPQVKGCLIIGQPRHLQNVSFKDFAEKISTRVDATVSVDEFREWEIHNNPQLTDCAYF